MSTVIDVDSVPTPTPEDVAQAATVASVRKTLETVVSILDGLSKWTSSDVDDKIVATLRGFMNETWFLELLVMLLNLREKGESNEVVKTAALEFIAQHTA